MILVANGCSHTAGAEITYPMERACYHKAWPKHLSDLLQFGHCNLSDSGASAHRIVRTTIRYALDQFKQKKKLSKLSLTTLKRLKRFKITFPTCVLIAKI